jgi:DNA-binding IclR family transcriptional regulator
LEHASAAVRAVAPGREVRAHFGRPGAENPGTVRPANCTALGKVLLASMQPDMFEKYLTRGELVRRTDKSICEAEPLWREVAQVRSRGLSFDDGELDPESRCIAAPVRNFTGHTVGALGISAPIWRMPVQTMLDVAPTVQEFAATLSIEFGYADDRQPVAAPNARAGEKAATR